MNAPIRKQQELYQQVILEHNKRPRNCHKPAFYNCHAEGFNPLCGDHVWVYLWVDENEIIREIAFEGEGCAICKASASMMTTTLKGKSIAESRELIDGFTLLLRGQIEPTDDEKKLGSLVVFSGIWQFPSRIKCASLAWHAACEAVTNKDGCRECPHGR